MQNTQNIDAGTYRVQKITPDGKYVQDFLEWIKQVPELKYNKWIPWIFWIKYVESLIKSWADIYWVINENKELVGWILLSDTSLPRETTLSKTDPNRKETFDQLHDEEGYKYASYGYLNKSDRGKVSFRELLPQIDQKFYSALGSKSRQRLFEMVGWEKVEQPDGTVMKNIRNGSDYIKYNSEK